MKRFLPGISSWRPVLPSFITLCSLFCGYCALYAAFSLQIGWAVLATYLAVVFDNLDGMIARLINAQSAFGRELDSLADMTVFSLPSAVLIVMLQPSGIVFLISFIFVACHALRLARFNISTFDPGHFQGLPVPIASGGMITACWAAHMYTWPSVILPVLMLLLSFLMVSEVVYPHFKAVDPRQQWPYAIVALLILGLVFYGCQMILPGLMLMTFLGYLLSPLLSRL